VKTTNPSTNPSVILPAILVATGDMVPARTGVDHADRRPSYDSALCR